MPLVSNQGLSRYRQEGFWENMLYHCSSEQLLQGQITGERITQETIFLYQSYIDDEKNIAVRGWFAHDSFSSYSILKREVMKQTKGVSERGPYGRKIYSDYIDYLLLRLQEIEIMDRNEDA